MCLKSVGFGLECVPFHEGWKLVVWEPCLPEVVLPVSKLVEVCDETESEELIEFVGPQIVLDLGEGSSILDEEPTVEVPDVVPTVVVEEEDSSVEVLISGEKMKADQAEGTGTEPVPDEAVVREVVQVVGIGEPIPGDDRSGEAPDLMEVDLVVRTGGSPVREEGTEARPDLGSSEGDLRMEDFPGDDFEKVGDFHPEEPSKTPPVPGPE